jgi:uncharacterized protein YaiL (DUF2058 family)
MRNPLQEQLLKAGLVKKAKVAEVVREQNKQRHGKAAAAPVATQATDAQREKAERDRAIAAERNEKQRAAERLAQVKQIVAEHRLPRKGEISYRFSDGNTIASFLVDESMRAQLAAGALVVVRHGNGYEVLPRVAADKVRERDASLVVVDHAQAGTGDGAEDEFYGQFKVPDDLVW